MEPGFWKKLKKPIMIMAPMSGVTDEPFRLMLLKHGKPSVFWTEFISASALNSPKGRKYCLDTLKFAPDERPIVAQIFGADPLQIEKASREIASLGFDGIDINMGCPDRDIEKQGAGSALINNPALAKEVIRAAIRGARCKQKKLPVSVKTRIGYNKNEISKWMPALLEENISALTVHLRARKETYSTPAHWELAKEIVKLRDKYAPKTLIIGNGDVKSVAEARELVKKTLGRSPTGEAGMDGVMFGRSVLGNPWFFSEKIPTTQERLDAIIEHAEIFSAQGGPASGWESIKKHFHAYAKGFTGARELRENLMKVKNAAETKKVIENFLKNVV